MKQEISNSGPELTPGTSLTFQIMAPPLASWVTLGYHDTIYCMELCGLNEIIGTKRLAWCLAREGAGEILAVITIISLVTSKFNFVLDFSSCYCAFLGLFCNQTSLDWVQDESTNSTLYLTVNTYLSNKSKEK